MIQELPSASIVKNITRGISAIVHSLVYDFAQSESYASHTSALFAKDDDQNNVTPEDEVSLYRISGAALCRMIKLRRETLSNKKGRRHVSAQTRKLMEDELQLLENLKESDKSGLPDALKILDEGNLTFFKKNIIIEFVSQADLRVRELINDKQFRKHKQNLLNVVHFIVYNDVQLREIFQMSVNNCIRLTEEDCPCSVVIDKIFKDLLQKLCNTRVKEYFRGNQERELAVKGKVVDADQSLRDSLKTFSVKKRRS